MFNIVNEIVFVDIDDTLGNTREAVASLYRAMTGKEPLDINTTKSKRYHKFCPLWTDDFIENLFKSGKEIYSILKPFDGAVEGIEYLTRKGYDVRIVTMNHPESIQYKYEWIKKYFPRLADRVYYVDWRIENKDVFKGYSIIDDDIKNIKTNQSFMPILFDLHGVYDGVPMKSKVCKSWEEIISNF